MPVWRAHCLVALQWWVAVLPIGVSITSAPIAAASPIKQTASEGASTALAVVDRIVTNVRAARRLDRSSIERLLGVSLLPGESTRSFRLSRTSPIRKGPLMLTVELREPIEGSGATAGPLLIVTIVSGCPARRDVAARYEPWTLVDVPRGRSLQEEASWSRREARGTLSFGFAEAAPDCLRSIAFDTDEAGPVDP